MQAFTPLALLILGVAFVKGDYWWMNNEGAFGGNSEPQIIRESNGGYGGGKRQSQTVKGYPQKTKEYTQNEGGYQQNTGGYSEEYPQEYPNNGGYPQGNSNGVTISGDPSQKLQDNSGKKKQQQPPKMVTHHVWSAGGVCPTGLSCVPQSQCQQPRVPGIQERVANVSIICIPLLMNHE